MGPFFGTAMVIVAIWLIPGLVVLILWTKNTERLVNAKNWPTTPWQRSSSNGRVVFTAMRDGKMIRVVRSGPYARHPDPSRYDYSLEIAESEEITDGSIFWGVPRRLFYLLEKQHQSHEERGLV